MSIPQTKTFLLTAALCAALAACGGGDDDGESTPTTPTTPVTPTFADCFRIVDGLAYTMTDPDGGDASQATKMVREAFEGVTRPAMVEMAGTTDVRSAASYWSAESNGIRFWGNLAYDANGAAEAKTLHSDGFLLPLNMQAGQSAALTYTDTSTQLSGTSAGQTETVTRQENWTFEGFESLTLGGHTFANVCRIRVTDPADTEFGPSKFWYAPGAGIIKFQSTNSAGEVIEESVLKTITAQPLEW